MSKLLFHACACDSEYHTTNVSFQHVVQNNTWKSVQTANVCKRCDAEYCVRVWQKLGLAAFVRVVLFIHFGDKKKCKT